MYFRKLLLLSISYIFLQDYQTNQNNISNSGFYYLDNNCNPNIFTKQQEHILHAHILAYSLLFHVESSKKNLI